MKDQRISNPKKILIISEFFPPYIYGGAEVSTSLLAKNINTKYQVDVVTSQLQKNDWEWKGVHTYPLLKRHFLRSKSISSLIKYAAGTFYTPVYNIFKIRKFLKNNDYECVNVITTSYALSPVIFYLTLILRKNVVLDIRDFTTICVNDFSYEDYVDSNQPHNCFNHLKNMYSHSSKAVRLLSPVIGICEISVFKIYKLLLMHAINRGPRTRAAALSQFVKNKLTINGFDDKKIKVIYNIGPGKVPTAKTSQKLEYEFIYAGRIEKAKGIWNLIKAYELIGDDTIRVAIVGQGAQYKKLKQYVAKNHLKNIKLLGKVSPAEVLSLYERSKYIIAPVIRPEPFGRFIQESAFTGKPLLASNSGGIPEIIKDGVNGLLALPGNPISLKEKMIVALKLKDRQYKNLCKASINNTKLFLPEIIIKQRVALYENFK